MTDVNASLSASASSTSGLQSDYSATYGDIIIGSRKPTPPYLWIALAVVALVGVSLWLVRR